MEWWIDSSLLSRMTGCEREGGRKKRAGGSMGKVMKHAAQVSCLWCKASLDRWFRWGLASTLQPACSLQLCLTLLLSPHSSCFLSHHWNLSFSSLLSLVSVSNSSKSQLERTCIYAAFCTGSSVWSFWAQMLLLESIAATLPVWGSPCAMIWLLAPILPVHSL